MTSPQAPRPPHNAAPGPGVNEETLHLPTTTAGMTAQAPGAPRMAPPSGPIPGAQRTAPSPYPQRPAFRAPAPPSPSDTGGHPRPVAAPPEQPPAVRWEGVGFRPDIQGLRAVAVVLVLLGHAGFSFFKGGYVGVDVFFVLSGFLITSLLVKEMHDTGTISLSGFFSRRARRILPAAGAVVAATVVGSWLWFPVTRVGDIMQDAFTVIVYIVNYRFIAEQTEYLNADQSPSPFQQFWSLAVEEQFYFVWPLLLIGVLLLAKRVPRKAVGFAVAAISVVFALSLIASIAITETNPTAAYYAAHTRVWELAAGALLALTLPTWRKVPKATAAVLGLIGIAAVLVSAVLYSEATPFPGYTAMLPVLGTMMVLVAGTATGENPASRLLSTAPFQFFGKISYSLYLWHWPILILGPLAIGVGVEPSLTLNIILLASAVGVAQVSYACIETPVRKAKFLGLQPVYGILSGVACSLVALFVVIAFSTVYSKVPEAEETVALDDIEQVQDLSSLEQGLKEGLQTTSIPENMVPSLTGAEFDKPEPYNNGCHLGFEETSWPDHCEFGDTESDTVVVLIGDSHAGHWFPALDQIAEERGWKLLTRTKSSCTPVSATMMQDGVEYTECDEAREAAFAEIDEINPYLVVIGTTTAGGMAGVDGDDERMQRWLDGWEETIGRVQGEAEHVVSIGDTPWGEESIPECLAVNEDSVQECTIDQDDGIQAAERRQAGMDLQQELGVTVVEPTGWFCVDGKCPVIVDGMMVYRDKHHISTPYMRSIASLLAEQLPQ
ncbi:SGNH hydrolase domain-containing protein [Glycomyces luteolus]|uniref:SGNH hydrolase domain-containing protein n=1 Tax=Glycomyces luteolus TaxID=2670330 RepID=A0A9X3PFJ0_9ACTN|nr:acyltransferase family protein [Glycomyces luteolus]MDA1362543.1 SGNH hydrolase domain-containing protein [Glycomyces luteolus]